MNKGHSKAAVPLGHSIGLHDFARLAIVLTAGTGLATLLVAPFQRGPEVVTVATALFAGFALVIWGVSMTIGLVVVAPPRAWRLLRRIAFGRPRRPGEGGGLRDAWLDGPDSV